MIEEGITDPTAAAQIAFALTPERLLEEDGKSRGGEYYAAHTVQRALQRTKPRPTGGDWFTASACTSTALPVPLSTFRVITGVIAAKKLPVRRWLVQPRLPIGDVFQLVGEPGTSKSTFALRDALAVATNRESLLRGMGADGEPVTAERLHRSGAVVVYNAEDRLDEMERRLAAAQRHYGVTSADMKHAIVLWSGVDGTTLKIMHRSRERGALQRAPGADTLEATINKHGAVLAILDPQISLRLALPKTTTTTPTPSCKSSR